MENRGSEYLAHHGILGMKWGKRRFQNEDGSLTPEGRARYSDKDEKDNSKKEPESSTWKSSDAKYLSDEELNRRNSRLQREQQYQNLTEPRAAKVRKWIASTASTILVASLIGAAKGAMSNNYGVAINSGIEKIKAFAKSGLLRNKVGRWG